MYVINYWLNKSQVFFNAYVLWRVMGKKIMCMPKAEASMTGAFPNRSLGTREILLFLDKAE